MLYPIELRLQTTNYNILIEGRALFLTSDSATGFLYILQKTEAGHWKSFVKMGEYQDGVKPASVPVLIYRLDGGIYHGRAEK